MCNRTIPAVVAVLLLGMAGCLKYNPLHDLSGPAYIRVFNDISTRPNVQNNGNLDNFLTFVLDPIMDHSNVPVSGAMEGDYLATRYLYNISYPIDAANTVTGFGLTNYEYPGRSHILRAPVINGFDCSSWAQIPAGIHRILFIARPNTVTPFDSLSSVNRGRILIDTTVNFTAGELYTVEAVLQKLYIADNQSVNTYGAYVRQEEFTHANYSSDSLYVGVYNLSAAIDPADANVYTPYNSWFMDTLQITGASFFFDHTFNTFDTVPGVPTLSLDQHFATHASYLVFPLLPQSDFFDPEGNLGSYGEHTDGLPSQYALGNDLALIGTLPFNRLTFNSTFDGNSFFLYFWASPVNYNTLYGNSYLDPYQFELLPNLNLITSLGTANKVYPTVNLLEIINKTVYMTQVQKGFPQLP